MKEKEDNKNRESEKEIEGFDADLVFERIIYIYRNKNEVIWSKEIFFFIIFLLD